MENKNTQLYVITGFLGSGKTTLLHNIILNLSGSKIGVIQNEFGKVGIDGDVLRNDDIQMVEINKGSIFCSCLKLNFVQALSEMVTKGFNYLFVESSGLGDPSNVKEILDAAKLLSKEEYDFRGVICLVDAVNFLEQLNDLETVNRQLKHCHMAVLTKSDLVDEKRVEEIKKKIREINPACRIEVGINGQMDLSFLKDDLLEHSWAEGEDTTNVPEDKPKTVFIEFERKIQKNELVNFLNDIKGEAYRIKGFVNLSETGWNKVDVVGMRTDFLEIEEEHPMSQLVIISKVGPRIIRSIDSAWKDNTDTPMKIRN